MFLVELSPAFSSASPGAELGLKLYYIQLALNLGWTPLFFGMKLVRPPT